MRLMKSGDFESFYTTGLDTYRRHVLLNEMPCSLVILCRCQRFFMGRGLCIGDHGSNHGVLNDVDLVPTHMEEA